MSLCGCAFVSPCANADERLCGWAFERLCGYAFGRPCVNALLRLGVSASGPGGVVLGCSLGLEPRAPGPCGLGLPGEWRF